LRQRRLAGPHSRQRIECRRRDWLGAPPRIIWARSKIIAARSRPIRRTRPWPLFSSSDASNDRDQQARQRKRPDLPWSHSAGVVPYGLVAELCSATMARMCRHNDYHSGSPRIAPARAESRTGLFSGYDLRITPRFVRERGNDTSNHSRRPPGGIGPTEGGGIQRHNRGGPKGSSGSGQ
jgi:hypothetical protein